MKIKRILPMILALALLLFAGCTDPGQSTGPDGDEPGITDPDENPDDGKDPDDGVQTVTLEGVVADVFGTALSGVAVALDGASAATTDASGAFSVAEVDPDSAESLTFTADGYLSETVALASYLEGTEAGGTAELGTVSLVKNYGTVSGLEQTDWAQAEDFTFFVTRDVNDLLVRAVSPNKTFTAQGRESKLEIYLGVGTPSGTRDENVTKVTIESDGTVEKENYGGRSLASYTVVSSVTEAGDGLTVELAIPYAMLGCARADELGFAAGLYSNVDGERAEMLNADGSGVVDVADPTTYLRVAADNTVTAPDEAPVVDRGELTKGYSLRFSVPSLSNQADVADDFYLKADKQEDGFLVSMIGFGDFESDEYVKLIFHTSETDGSGWNIQASDLTVLVNAEKATYRTGLTKFWTTDGGYSKFDDEDTLLTNAPVYSEQEGYFTLTLKVLFTEIPEYSADGEVSLFAMEFAMGDIENGLIYDASNYLNGMLIDGVSHGDPAAQSSYFVIQSTEDDSVDQSLIEGFGLEFSMGADHIYAKVERGATSMKLTLRSFGTWDNNDFIRLIVHTADYDCSDWGLALSDVSFTIYQDAAYWQTGKIYFSEGADDQFHGTDTTIHAPEYTQSDGYWTLTLTIEYIEFGTGILQDTSFRAMLVEYTNGTANFGAKQDGVALESAEDQANWFVL